MDTNATNTQAMNRFAHSIGLDKLRIGHRVKVTAVIHGETKYEEYTEVFYVVSNKYGNPEISIFWNLPDPIQKDLGLCGVYSSVYYDFSYNQDDEELVILDDDIKIYLSSKN